MKPIDVGETIYKYMPLTDNSQRLSWVIDIIEKEELYISNVRDLNDPFEMLLAAHKKIRSIELDSFNAKLNDLQNLTFNAATAFAMKGHLKELLWSHYADCWKGIRMHFEVLEDHKIYLMNYFSKSHDITDEETHLDILRKLKAWKYEKECRFISKKAGKESFQRIGIRLTRIDIGIRADKNIAEIIKQKCQAKHIQCDDINKIADVFQN